MKLWLPLSILVIVTVIASGVALMTRNYSPPTVPPLPVNLASPQSNNPVSSPALVEKAQVSVSLQPETTSAQVGQEVSFQILVNSGDKIAIGVDSVFDYDPKVYTVVSVEPGTLLPQADVLLKEINPQAGTIRYALGTKTPQLGNGIAMVIKLKINQAAELSKIPFGLNREKTQVAVETANHSKRFGQTETILTFNEQPLTILSQKTE